MTYGVRLHRGLVGCEAPGDRQEEVGEQKELHQRMEQILPREEFATREAQPLRGMGRPVL